MSKKLNIALVGGAGFLGTALAESLKGDMQVRIIDTPLRLKRCRESVALSDVELLATESPFHMPEDHLAGCEVLIHLAWRSIPSTSMDNLLSEVRDNIAGSVSLMETARKASVSKFIFFSSGGAVYGGSHNRPIPETAPTQPISAYGIGKRTVEDFARLAASRNDFTSVIFRLTNPFGPYQLAGTPVGVIANAVRKLWLGESLEVWGDGSIVRDFIYIDDVAAAVRMTIESQSIESGIYNLSSGVGHSVADVLNTVESTSGQKLEVRFGKKRTFDVPWVVLDNTKLRKELDWAPSISLRDGIKRLLSTAPSSCNSDTSAV